MFRLKKSTKIIIIIAIVFVAGYFAVRLSGIQGIFSQKIIQPTIDDLRAEEVFKNAGNKQKIKLLYSTDNLLTFNSELQKVYSSYDINPMYSNDTPNYYVSVFAFEDSLSEKVMTDLRSLKRLNQEFLDTPDPDKYEINIKDHIENKERVKRTLENKIDNAIMLTEDRINKYNNNLTNIQLEIDSLRNQQKIIKNLASQKLVYVATLFRNAALQANLKTRRINMVKNFLIYLLVFLVISILVLVIINYFIIFILYIMRLLGIRTARSSSGGRYSYGSYSYKSNYYSRKPRKVKKIYKDADGNIVKQKITKE